MQKVAGIGGMFFRGRDAVRLRAWYAENLGIDVDQEWGGARFGPSGDGTVTWAVFPSDTEVLWPTRSRPPARATAFGLASRG